VARSTGSLPKILRRGRSRLPPLAPPPAGALPPDDAFSKETRPTYLRGSGGRPLKPDHFYRLLEAPDPWRGAPSAAAPEDIP